MQTKKVFTAALLLAVLATAVHAETAPSHPQKLFRAYLGRKMLSALGLTAADATNTAQIWPPRDPVGPNCYGAYCQSGGWSNYGYTQAVPADGNPNLTPDGYMRPVPLARPMVSGRH